MFINQQYFHDNFELYSVLKLENFYHMIHVHVIVKLDIAVTFIQLSSVPCGHFISSQWNFLYNTTLYHSLKHHFTTPLANTLTCHITYIQVFFYYACTIRWFQNVVFLM